MSHVEHSFERPPVTTRTPPVDEYARPAAPDTANASLRSSRRDIGNNHARGPAQNPELISSMIDSLDHFAPPPQTAEPWSADPRHTRHSSQNTIEDGLAAPPPAGPGIFDRPYEELDNPRPTWQAEETPSHRFTTRSRRSSQAVETAPPPSNGQRRLLTSASSRSRTSLAVQSNHQAELDPSDRVSIRSFSSAQPDIYSTPPMTASGYAPHRTPTPQRSLRRRKSSQNLVADRSESSSSRAIPDERSPNPQTDYNTKRSIPSTALSSLFDSSRERHAVQHPSVQSFSSEEVLRNHTPVKKSSRSVTSSRRVSPALGPITDSIPQRKSSLHQTEKRSESDRKKSKIKSWTGKKHTSGKREKKKALNDEAVLEELGEDDETVKRIRELKQQREARRRLEIAEDNGPDMPRFSHTLPVEPSQPLPDQLPVAQDTRNLQRYLEANARPRNDRLSPSRPTFAASTTSSTSQLRAPSDYDYGEALLALEPDALRPASAQATRRGVSIDGGGASAPRPRAASVDLRRKSIFSDLKEDTDDYHPSIDVEVDAFLNAPRVNRSVRHPKTSRIISFADVGDPNGHPVFVCVGMGLTRFVSTFYDELATTLGLRLITPERPGVGRSQGYTYRDTPGPLSWHQDVHAICMALKIESFSLLAHSAGAVFALATALVLPHLVTGKIYLLAPWIPPSQFEISSSVNGVNGTPDSSNDSPPSGTLPRSQRLLRVLPVSLLKAANSSFLGINTNSMSPATPSPTPIPTRPKSRRRSLSSNPFGGSSPGGRDSFFAPVPEFETRSSVDADAMIRSANAEAAAAASLPMPASLLTASHRSPRTPFSSRSQGKRRSPVQSQQIAMSATAFPTDTDLVLASTHLSAAEHAATYVPPMPSPRHQNRADDALYTSVLLQRVWAASTRDSNPADDLLVCLERNKPVGFRYVDVRKRLVILHGTEDKRVDLRNIRWLVSRLNAARRLRREAARSALRIAAGKSNVASANGNVASGSPLDPRSAWKGGNPAAASPVTSTSHTPNGKGAGQGAGQGAGSVVGLGISGVIRDGEEGDGVDADDEGDCELRVLEGQGHGLMAVARVMGDVLCEIAEEHVPFSARRKTGPAAAF